jgi:hypothetical protein
LPDDDRVAGMLGSSGLGSRLPPVDRRSSSRRERRKRRRRSTRVISREEAGRARRELEAEIERGNQVLARLGHQVRLQLLPGRDGAPDRVAVSYPADGAAGARCVARTVRLRDLQKWLARLEGLEGLVVDTQR